MNDSFGYFLLIRLNPSQEKPAAFATCDISNNIFTHNPRRFGSFIRELKNKLL